jgi:putative salt-induced outer membrane protein YdiY
MSKQSLHRTIGSAATLAAGISVPLFIGAAQAHAQAAAAAAAAPPVKPWQNKITAGLTYADGNNESLQAMLSAESKRKWEHDDLTIYGQFGYGWTQDQIHRDAVTDAPADKITSENYVFGNIQWNHLFTPKWYGGLRASARHDEVADLQYRFTVSPLAGYYIIKTDKDTLNVEAGPSYIWERQADQYNSYFALRFAEKYEHKFSDKARIWEGLEYLPEVEDWTGNYIINAEIGIETALTKALSLRVVAQDSFDSQPGSTMTGNPPTSVNLKKNEFRVIVGITYAFGF